MEIVQCPIYCVGEGYRFHVLFVLYWHFYVVVLNRLNRCTFMFQTGFIVLYWNIFSVDLTLNLICIRDLFNIYLFFLKKIIFISKQFLSKTTFYLNAEQVITTSFINIRMLRVSMGILQIKYCCNYAISLYTKLSFHFGGNSTNQKHFHLWDKNFKSKLLLPLGISWQLI